MADKDRFGFGENWRKFSELITEERIQGAVSDMSRLLHADEIKGKTFFDIGSGSGLHSLAALRLGAESVTAIDYDPDSVETTRAVLERFAPSGPWSVSQGDVFDLSHFPRFDIVYSWGVLHHTGDLKRAIRCAAEKVKPGGTLCIAIYRKTLLCGVWRFEKRFYTRSSPRIQEFIRRIWLWWIAVRVTGMRRESLPRGMDVERDAHDWLGGYPYESMRPRDVQFIASSLGFDEVRSFANERRSIGLRGSGCDEFVFRRSTA